MGTPESSTAITHGIRVTARPRFLPEHSDPDERRWVFGYRIRITNEAERSARLLSRRWEIVDRDGRAHVVEGEGVIGQQPLLEPGRSFEYSSFAPLHTPWGTMEGWYTFQWVDGDRFRVEVKRFYLVSAGFPQASGARA
ncbi:MAG: Co2+/Mg2+ efflux protein ApaG [Phycisphaerae bacterium]|nr:Co2+/Mg2+ efflux protein ApaG [Phycisphaerae bacterium]